LLTRTLLTRTLLTRTLLTRTLLTRTLLTRTRVAPWRLLMTTRRTFLHLAAGAAALPAASRFAKAQTWPARQITLIAPWPAGGAIDALCRIMAPGLAERLGKPIVVENRPGAGSVLGVAVGARAAPDGYTLTMAGSGSLAIGVTLNKTMPYDPLRDVTPIAFTGYIPFILVCNPALPVNSVTDLISYARNNPGKLSFASGGPGSPHHLLMEVLKSMAGIEMTHVPYKGSAPALTDVIAGHLPLLFSDTIPSLPMIREGKVRALGVSTAARLPSAPDIPPIAEVGLPGFDASGWGMIVAPTGTPSEIVSKVHAATQEVHAIADVRQQIVRLGMVPAPSPPPDRLRSFVSSEIERWGKAIRQAGLAGSEG
jgi:tripartite-type tricarboxylate transporter receptor subunit TctC